MKAAGYWAWWNHYGSVPLAKCIARAKAPGVSGVIVKAGHWVVFDAFAGAGVRVAVEAYVYPNDPIAEARQLAAGLDRGAAFAVINAEVEWENAAGGPAMQRLIGELRRLHPNAELYASVDTRGSRTHLPFQQVLGQHVAGWLPEVYPKAFRPAMPADSVSRAFGDCLDGAQDFQGTPLLPTIQTYEAIGANAVAAQVAECRRRKLPGCQSYTIGHATDEEWAAFVNAIPRKRQNQEEDDMTFIAWAAWKDRPNDIPFRSYKLFVGPDGLTKGLVPNAEEHNALAAAGLKLRQMPLAELKAYAGDPQPDAP